MTNALIEAGRAAWEHKEELGILFLMGLAACTPQELQPKGRVVSKTYVPAKTELKYLLMPKPQTCVRKVCTPAGFNYWWYTQHNPEHWEVEVNVCEKPVPVTPPPTPRCFDKTYYVDQNAFDTIKPDQPIDLTAGVLKSSPPRIETRPASAPISTP